jgi:ATP-dependent DNA helicase RecQ
MATAAKTTNEWSAIRRMVLERDGYRCVECQEPVKSPDADVHHSLPRSMGGTDEPSNLVTLCDGCHAAHHPMLAAGLARRALERWAVRLARIFDYGGYVSNQSANLGPALRLLGADRFRDGQLAIVQAALRGRSVLVVRPTGSGKTLCFQLPALLQAGPTVVIAPLRALMAEQVSSLLRKKVPATFLNSDLDRDEKERRYSLLRRKAIKLLYLAPERFFVRNSAERQRLSELRPAFLVVDEAHCVDQWGQDFRPEYGRLAQVRAQLGDPPMLAFTATAGRAMQQRILESLGIPDADVFVSDVDRPNIAMVRWNVVGSYARAKCIAELLSLPLPAGGKAMVFVPSTRVGDQLQQALAALGMHIPFYHSRLDAWEREQLVKRFTNQSEPRLDSIIATSAFGMGLDISGLRLVIHWQPPGSLEDYLQEFGRAGRDGKPAVAIVLHDLGLRNSDTNRLRFMAEHSGADGAKPSDSVLSHRYAQIDTVFRAVLHQGCFREQVRRHFASGPTPKKRLATTILEWLFSKPARVTKIHTCCDACGGDQAADRLDFVRDLLKCQ